MSRRNEYDSVKNKEEFKLSIDGKDFDYRDPRKTTMLLITAKAIEKKVILMPTI